MVPRILWALGWVLFLQLFLFFRICMGRSDPTIVGTFIVRDEDVNLKVNLPLWASFIDYFVFMVDSRTKDNSVSTIESILTQYNRPRVIRTYEFQGFGAARTHSLTIAWEIFNNASHVLIADPDWRPDLSTLSKSDLDDAHDVFRFTVFDRNGATRRRMDWLLRQRKGLAMRYRLHEVLDIGLYTVKEIGWKIHEIEQIGSWHASVGHGNSMSIARLNFDLHLLLGDLLEFGVDPHTHYYLGTTYHGVAEKQLLEMGVYNETAIENSIKFLKLRLFSNYSAEFFEERWGCMYILGSIYGSIKKDYPSAINWMSMCRDFNPNQVECSLSLSRYYYYYGMIDKSLVELEKILQRGHEDRIMLNMLRTRDCSVPELVIDLFNRKSHVGALTLGDAKFMMLMVHMLENPLCNVRKSLRSEVWVVISPILAHQSDYSVHETSSVDYLCGQPDVQTYLATKLYKIHPCKDFQIALDIERSCMMFSSNLPPANEELQLSIGGNTFIGAANMPDVLHHVWQGDFRRLAKHSQLNPFRILFAEFFNPKMVENVLGYFHRTQFTHFIIVVVSKNSQAILSMKESIEYCGKLKGISSLSHVEYVESDLTDYLHQIIAQNKNGQKVAFDYIEFNAGVCKSADAMNQLDLLGQTLTEDGTLGLTYFSKNKHEDSIRKQLLEINQTAFIPFSFEAKRFIHLYLESHGMEFFTKDEELIIFLGGEPAQRKYPPSSVDDLIPAERWKSFSQQEVIDMLDASNMVPVAWIPTAYSHPYEQLKHYSVQRFKNLGVSESDFIQNYLTFFRYSLYAKSKSVSTCSFKPFVTVDMFLDQSIAKKVFVTDRLGSLGQSFAPLVESAKGGHFGQLGFAPYALNQKFAVDYTVSPLIAPSLALLSQTPSLNELLATAIQFPHNKVKESNDHTVVANLLSDMLNFLASINTITFIRQDGPLFSCIIPSSDQVSSISSSVSKLATVNGELEIQAERMRELGFDEDFINEALQSQHEDNQSEKTDPAVMEANIKTKLSSILKILHEKTESFPTTGSKVRSALDTIEKLRDSVVHIPKSNIEDFSIKHEDALKKHAELAEGVAINFKFSSHPQKFYRSLTCFQSLRKGVKHSSCAQAKPVKRRTAAIQSTSYAKVFFDVWVGLNANRVISDNDAVKEDIDSYLQALNDIKSFMESKDMAEPIKCHRLTSPDIASKSVLMNHGIYIHEVEIPLNHTLFQWGALQQIKEVVEEHTLDRNDYVVLDVLLQLKALDSIRNILTTSTIWYDATNGAAFAAHFDDGLASLPIFTSVAKQIALALSVRKAYHINKFYALSLPHHLASVSSPISLGNRNEVVAVIWITGPHRDNYLGEDGIRVYDPLAADCLFGQGISFYPSVHPEFLSKGGDLTIDLSERCNDYHSERIDRLANRMVLIRDRMPFFFKRTTADTTPAIAIVIHLGVK